MRIIIKHDTMLSLLVQLQVHIIQVKVICSYLQSLSYNMLITTLVYPRISIFCVKNPSLDHMSEVKGRKCELITLIQDIKQYNLNCFNKIMRTIGAPYNNIFIWAALRQKVPYVPSHCHTKRRTDG